MAITIKNELLNLNVGFQDILPPPDKDYHLPTARPLATNVIAESSLASLFQLVSSDWLIDRALSPELSNPDLLRPEIFRDNLKGAFQELANSRNPDVRRFVNNDLEPLMANNEILSIYCGLLVSG
ncbi:MAG: hypothetical protein LBT86_06105 [Deltaproteobacteria bacterium]|jgi:hypothetical protein|nr:hypothetical protein [Deltaproteobacteria bacterium]